jgi:hypothetical protein
MKEWQRTVVLLVLLAGAIGFMIWSQNQAEQSIQRTIGLIQF